MADIRLFGSHFESFSFVDEDTSVRPMRVDGKMVGNVDVKGFPSFMEVLTSRGWVSFTVLGEWLKAEYRLWEEFVVGFNHHKASGLSVDSFPINDYVFDPVLVASVSPYSFDEVSQVGVGGKVVFVQPTGFSEWVYDGKLLVNVKMRGLDFCVSQYSDLVVKKRWKGGYGFVSAGDVVGNRYGGYFYLMLNRFSRDIGGGFNPNLSGEVLDGFVPLQQLETSICVVGRGAEVSPSQYVSRVTDYVGSVFNVLVAPYHNVVVRRERERRVDGSVGKRPLSGKPVVVGDLSFKSLDSFRVKGNGVL